MSAKAYRYAELRNNIHHLNDDYSVFNDHYLITLPFYLP